jgi:hypothetical protein
MDLMSLFDLSLFGMLHLLAGIPQEGRRCGRPMQGPGSMDSFFWLFDIDP